MYTGATFDSSGQYYSLQYKPLTYLEGWQGVGRLISDRMSYRNNYMSSGEATSNHYNGQITMFPVYSFPEATMHTLETYVSCYIHHLMCMCKSIIISLIGHFTYQRIVSLFKRGMGLGCCRFGDVKEQTKNTDRLTDILVLQRKD